MAKRLLLAAICLLLLPVFYSSSGERSLKDITPFQSVALAGHTLWGGWCECGGSFAGCICDPGEEPAGQRVHPAPIESNQGKPTQGKATELGSGILLVLAALLITLRYKA